MRRNVQQQQRSHDDEDVDHEDEHSVDGFSSLSLEDEIPTKTKKKTSTTSTTKTRGLTKASRLTHHQQQETSPQSFTSRRKKTTTATKKKNETIEVEEEEMDAEDGGEDEGIRDYSSDFSSETAATTTTSTSKLRRFVEGVCYRTIEMDVRSVALLRVLLGLTTLYDLWDRSHDLYAHYTDLGVFPRFVSLTSHYSHLYQISLHAIGGTLSFASIVFAIHALVALLLVVGYRSQTMALLNWALINSLIARCPPVTHGGDNYLKVVAFFSITLPLGACFSLDALLSSNYAFNRQHQQKQQQQQQQRHRRDIESSSPSPYEFCSPTSFAYVLQIALIYVTGFFHKSGDDWVVTRTATYYALSMSFFRRPPVGDLLMLFPSLMKLMTTLVLWWEGLGPLLFVCPIYHGPVRTFAAIGFSLMHLGFGLSMRLDEFIYIGMSAPLCLLPSWFWDSLFIPFLRRHFTSLGEHSSQVIRKSFTSATSHNDDINNSIDNDYKRRAVKNKKSRIDIVYTSTVPHFELNAKLACTFLLLPHTYKVHDASTYEKPQTTDRDDGSSTTTPSSLVWMIVDPNGSKQYGYNAFITIAKASPFLSWIPTRLLRIGLVKSGLWFFYDLFLSAYYYLYESSWSADSQMRKRLFSKMKKPKHKRTSGSVGGLMLESPMLNDHGAPIRRLLVKAVVISSIVFLIAWNLSYLELTKMEDYPAIVNDVGYLLQLDQGWSMFAPHPPHSEFYYTIVAKLEGGEEIELWRNGGIFEWVGNKQVNWDPPEPFHVPFYNHRWFKYYETYNRGMDNVEVHPLRLAFGRYLCREWNNRHSGNDTLYTFDVFYMWHDRYENYTFSEPHQELIWGHICYDKNETMSQDNVTSTDAALSNDASSSSSTEPEEDREQEGEGSQEGYQDYEGYEGYEVR